MSHFLVAEMNSSGGEFPISEQRLHSSTNMDGVQGARRIVNHGNQFSEATVRDQFRKGRQFSAVFRPL
jgi:hypothetical protein